MKFPLQIIVFLFSVYTFSQSHIHYHKAEDYIISNKLDSAQYHLNQLHDTIKVGLLRKLIHQDSPTYKDYYQFIVNLYKRENVDYLEIQRFVNRRVKNPINTKQINVDFFNIKWLLFTILTENTHLEKANTEKKKLENYVNQFSKNDDNFLWAQTKLKTHLIEMYFIENDLKRGKKLSLECLKIARNLNDTELQIAFLYNYANNLAFERKFDEYIEALEECLALEDKLLQKSIYYYHTIRNLVNIYIHKGIYDDKVFRLIDELYYSHATSYSYLLYAQLAGKLDKNSKVLETILKKFKVNTVLELVYKLEKLGENLNLNTFFYLIDKCSIALQNHKYYDEAMLYKQKAIDINKRIYSEELTASMANFEKERTIQLKEKEIANEKEQTRLYLIIASLCFFLLIISFFAIRKLRKQSYELKDKNTLIKKSLTEKELIISEMHHRVKNNFQLITSLLDLQTEELEDDDVKAIFEKGKSRIKSMSLIHQKLHGTDSGLIKFDDFIKLLVRELSFLYKLDDNLKLDIQVKEFYFDVDTAIPLSLILNELITNAFKYAFKSNENNALYISLEKASNNNFLLVFKDNGIGISEDFNVIATKGTGLKLVARLVRQLQGNLEMMNDSGVKFEILFKDTTERKKTV